MEPIRILNMFTILNRGGAETIAMNYYRHIDRSKVQFDFLVHRQTRGQYEDEIEELGGRIYRMMPIYPQNFNKYQKKVRDFFNEHKEYKIVHSHMSELGCYALIEAEKQGIPIRICHAHSAHRDFNVKMIVRNYFKMRMRPYITHMFTCSLDSGIWLYGEKNKSKFITQNNGIDAKKFCYNYNKAMKIRKELKIENKFVIGHVGRFNKVKNHSFLIDIFFEVYKREPNSVLILVGEGELENKIKSKVTKLGISDAVKFLGVRADIHRIFQAFDVFLFPSLFEGLPVTVIEAQASGLNCIVSNTITNEVNITGMVKYLSLQDSPETWANAIFQYKNGYLRENMFKTIACAGYDVEENAKWLEQFYLNEYKKIEDKKLLS